MIFQVNKQENNDWISIIQMVVGGGFVAGVVELGTWLRNRKADKVVTC